MNFLQGPSQHITAMCSEKPRKMVNTEVARHSCRCSHQPRTRLLLTSPHKDGGERSKYLGCSYQRPSRDVLLISNNLPETTILPSSRCLQGFHERLLLCCREAAACLASLFQIAIRLNGIVKGVDDAVIAATVQALAVRHS